MNATTPEVPWCEGPVIEFMCEVDRLLYGQYGIESEDLDAVAAAQEVGESPQEHVDWIAEHFNLESLPQ